MSNWTPIVQADISGGQLGEYLTAALAQGFDLPGAIADTVSRIRAACSTGNVLDVDATKIPNSLKGLAKRMIERRVKGFLNQTPGPIEIEDAKGDNSYLLRISDSKIRFEQADTPAGSAEMQTTSPVTVVTSHRPSANYENLHGLL